MKTWNVTMMNDPDDNGCTLSFTSVLAAFATAEWARRHGAWFVSVWK
jgi:hypothetical protein